MSKEGPMRGLKIMPLRLKVSRNSDCDGKWAFFAFWAYFERDNYKIRNSEVAYVHYSSSQWQGEGWEVHRWPIWNMYLLPGGLKVGQNSNSVKKWALIAFWAYLEIDNYELAFALSSIVSLLLTDLVRILSFTSSSLNCFPQFSSLYKPVLSHSLILSTEWWSPK